jgi:hypothetical protein
MISAKVSNSMPARYTQKYTVLTDMGKALFTIRPYPVVLLPLDILQGTGFFPQTI